MNIPQSPSPRQPLLLAAWSTTTTAFEKHQRRNARPYTDSPLSRWERAGIGTAVRS